MFKIRTFWIIPTIAVIAVIIGFSGPAFAQGGPPPGGGGGGGGGGKTTLSDLGCGVNEIARVNAADEWECSAELTANEAATVAAQSTADTAVGNAAAAQTTADTAVSGVGNHEVRLSTIEGENLGIRLGDLEGQNLDARVMDLEDSTPQDLLQTIIVSPVGPTAVENGLELFAAVATAASLSPTAENPVQIKIEPGIYDVSCGPTCPGIRLDFNYVSLVGSGPEMTVIRRTDEGGPGAVISVIGSVSASNISIRDLSIHNLRTVPFPGVPQRPTGIVVTTGSTGLLIENVSVIGAASSTLGAIELFFGASIRMNHVREKNHRWFVIGGTVEMANVESEGRIQSTALIRSSIVGELAGGQFVAGSQVLGAIINPASTRCVFSYDASFLPLGTDCQ